MAKKKKVEKQEPELHISGIKLYEMSNYTGESYPVIIGALVNGGLQKELNKPDFQLKDTELKKLISDFKKKEI